MRAIIAGLGLALLAAPAFAQDAPAGNAENGQRLFNQCRACHTINEGGRNGVGPNLHGVVGRQVASAPGFNYSPAFRGKAQEIGTWSEEHLRSYLDNPSAYIPGTRMAYPGFRGNQQNLSDVIAYLKQNS
jgi:cytochrome c